MKYFIYGLYEHKIMKLIIIILQLFQYANAIPNDKLVLNFWWKKLPKLIQNSY